MRSRLLVISGMIMLALSFGLVGCDDDDDSTQDACESVDCGHGTCVDTTGTASCACDAGYHAEGLTCVEDTAGNTPPEFTSSAPADATELVLTAYEFSCTDADGDALFFGVDTTTDTCDGTLVYYNDGTGDYTFMIASAAETPSCVLSIICNDGTDFVSQTQTVTIHETPAPWCVDDYSWPGQLDGTDDASSLYGGTIATAPWDSGYDAGLADLEALMPANGSTLAVNMPVTQATIIASYYTPDVYRVYIADANAVFKVFLTEDATQQLPFVPTTGKRISFTVTEISNYMNTNEITQVDWTGWAVDGTGFDVSVKEATAAEPVTAADVNEVVRVSGILVADGAVCGTGYLCYDLDYGADSTVVFRTGSFNVFPAGTCLTFQGPVTLFNDTPQLTTYGDMWWYTWDPAYD